MHPQEAQVAGSHNPIPSHPGRSNEPLHSAGSRGATGRSGARIARGIVVLCTLLVMAACGGGDDSPTSVNSAPEILQITLEKLAVAQGEEISISCMAEDPDNDPIFGRKKLPSRKLSATL